ncbi:MAG: cyclohexa-1,5-dienecarbonyl-CoA hydratase [Bacteroidia bacterium]|nr:cyclohexa-1,5-dienecarbonyl-CoA hydratase [Bacteroidia bacterium]
MNAAKEDTKNTSSATGKEWKKIRVEYLHSGAVASVILDDGKGNILDYIMMEDIQAALDSFSSNAALKLIVFEGAGKHFSFGASVEEHRKDSAAAMLRLFHSLFYSLGKLNIPCACKISGQCLGGGMELAIACHFLFADKSARFGQPELILGVFPPPASVILPEKIGLAKAEEIILTGKVLSADEAHQTGLLTQIFADRNVMNIQVDEWIKNTILPKSASSLRYAVKATRMKFNHILSNFLPQLEELYTKRLMETHDANEGINSFLEKRQPNWSNS